jgi:hypothetical protein
LSIYHFNSGSLIDQVTIRRSPGGGAVAYLHAREDGDSGRLEAVKRKLEREDLQWSPTLQDGKPVLEVRGFGRKDGTLLDYLKETRAIQGITRKQDTVEDHLTARQKFRQRTLQLSGVAYFAGDASFVYSGIKEMSRDKKISNPYKMLAGLSYAAGSWFVALFGRGDKSDMHLRSIARAAIKDLKSQGMEPPKESSIQAAAEAYNNGIGKRIVDFFEKYPAEMTNGLFGIAGALITLGAAKKLRHFNSQKHIKDTRTSLMTDVVTGLMTVAAGLVTIFVREEKPDPDAPPKTGFAGLMQKMKARPLGVAGGLLGAATLGHAVSSGAEYREAGKMLKNPGATEEQLKDAREDRKGIWGRQVFVGTNLLAEGLMAVSHTGNGHGAPRRAGLHDSVQNVVADLVWRTAPDKREAVLRRLTTLVSSRRHLSCDSVQFQQGVKEKLAKMEQNPWVNPVAPRPESSAISEPETSRWRDMHSARMPVVSHSLH